STTTGWSAPPRWARSGRGGVPTWPPRASWSTPRRGSGAPAGPWARTCSPGRPAPATGPCSSRPSSRPTPARCTCGPRSASGSSAPSRRPSTAPPTGWWGCTSCTGPYNACSVPDDRQDVAGRVGEPGDERTTAGVHAELVPRHPGVAEELHPPAGQRPDRGPDVGHREGEDGVGGRPVVLLGVEQDPATARVEGQHRHRLRGPLDPQAEDVPVEALRRVEVADGVAAERGRSDEAPGSSRDLGGHRPALRLA